MSNAFDVIDFRTQEGQSIKEHIETRIDELVRGLEDVSLSDRDTQAHRGGIRELRRLLNKRPQMVEGMRYSGMDFTKPRGGAA